MAQTQRIRHRFRDAFVGRDSITTSLLLHLSVGWLVMYFVAAPICQWLGDQEIIGNSHLGMLLIATLSLSLGTLASGWATARIAPRWCVVSWAVVNTTFLLLRVIPELNSSGAQGERWVFFQILLSSLIAFGLQTWILFATRRKVIHRLSTGCR